jgi:hypothetical protein
MGARVRRLCIGTMATTADREQRLRHPAAAGIHLPAITAKLEREGVLSFCDSYTGLSTAPAASWRRWRSAAAEACAGAPAGVGCSR